MTMSSSSSSADTSRHQVQLTSFPSRLPTSHTKRDLGSHTHTLRGNMNHTGASPEAINKPLDGTSGLDVRKLSTPRARTSSNIATQSPQQKLRRNVGLDKENMKLEETLRRPMMGRSATSAALRKSPMPPIKSGPIETDTLRPKSRSEALQATRLSRISKSNLRVKAPMAAQQSMGLTKTRSAIALRSATTNVKDRSVNVQEIATKQSPTKSGLNTASGKGNNTTVRSAAVEFTTSSITRSFKLRPSATSVFDTPFKSVAPETPWSPSILRTFFHASPSGPLEPLQLQGISESASGQTAMSALSPIKVCNEQESIGDFKHLRPVPSLGNVFYSSDEKGVTKESASDRAKVADDEGGCEIADLSSASGQSEHATTEDCETLPVFASKAGAEYGRDIKLNVSEETPQTATMPPSSTESGRASKVATFNIKHSCDTRPHDFGPTNPTPTQSKSVSTKNINNKYSVAFLSKCGESRPTTPRTPPSTPTHRPTPSSSSRTHSGLFPRLLTEFSSKHTHLGFSSTLNTTPGAPSSSSSSKIHALNSQTARTQRELANLRAAAATAATVAAKEEGEGKGNGRDAAVVGRGSVLARARVFGETIWTGSAGTRRTRVKEEITPMPPVEKVNSEAKKMKAVEVSEPEPAPIEATGRRVKEEGCRSGCTDFTATAPASPPLPSIVSAAVLTSTSASIPAGVKETPVVVKKVESEAKEMEVAEVCEPESAPAEAVGGMVKEDGQPGCTDFTTTSPTSPPPPSDVSAEDTPSCQSPVSTSTSASTSASTPAGVKKTPAGKRVLGCADSVRAVAMVQHLWKTRNFVLE